MRSAQPEIAGQMHAGRVVSGGAQPSRSVKRLLIKGQTVLNNYMGTCNAGHRQRIGGWL